MEANTDSSGFKIHLPEQGIFYNLKGTKDPVGPISLNELHEKFVCRDIESSTFIWYRTLSNWVPLKDCTGFEPAYEKSKIMTPRNIPASSLIAIIGGKELTLSVSEAREALINKELGRSDPVYSTSKKKWMRADQHDALSEFFQNLLIQQIQQSHSPITTAISSGQSPHEPMAVVSPNEPLATEPNITIQNQRSAHQETIAIRPPDDEILLQSQTILSNGQIDETTKAPKNIKPVNPISTSLMLLAFISFTVAVGTTCFYFFRTDVATFVQKSGLLQSLLAK